MAFADAQTGGLIIFGQTPKTVKIVGAVAKGDILGYSGGWKRALATVAGVIQGRAVAGEDGADGQDILAYDGFVIIGGDRFSGATTGGAVYVAEGTSNGMYTQTAPITTGDANKILGYAVSATVLCVNPLTNNDSIA